MKNLFIRCRDNINKSPRSVGIYVILFYGGAWIILSSAALLLRWVWGS